MSESEGKKELTGLARSIDALFSEGVASVAAVAPPPLPPTDTGPLGEGAEAASIESESPSGDVGIPDDGQIVHDVDVSDEDEVSAAAEIAGVGALGLAAATVGALDARDDDEPADPIDDPWADGVGEADQAEASDEAAETTTEELPAFEVAEPVAVEAGEAPALETEDAFSFEAEESPALVTEDAFSFEAEESPALEVADALSLEAEDLPLVDPAPVEDAAPAPEQPAADGPAPQADDDEFVPTPLDIAVDAYVGGDLDRASEIESLATELMAGRDIEPIARGVFTLTFAAGDPPDESVYAVAEAIIAPVVLRMLAQRMGSERVEERRQEYYLVCRTIGGEMATAIRNDLAETTDRLARRIHCDALVAMGESGRRMIEEMAVDENRFLVRNAVAMLGDLGGDQAVELVTSALANPDPRVRREALKALAKLQSEDSGELVVGLLDDPDDDVRLAAAVAAGELRVTRALRPLMLMLDASSDPDECLPVIRALGQLGDPGAVNSIEKHAVRSLFSKPRTDVRIAAYRALHLIGTPHAKQLLKDVVRDKDEEVKTAVKGMLYSK